jgi:uncharacterized membrane protein
MREVMLVLHFVGLTMGMGTGIAHAFLAMATSKMSADEATKFRLHTLVLGKMGHAGIGLLVVSGLYLITPYWKILPSSPLLILKLTLVVVLLIIITLISSAAKKAQKGDAEAHLKKIQQLGKITLPISIIIVILAVYIFH